MKNSIYTQDNSPKFNGLPCPECKAELKDTRPLLVLTCIPPKKEVNCSQCDYTGYREI